VWIDHHVMIMAGPAKSGRPGHQKNNPAYQFAKGELHIGNDVHIASFVMLQAHGGMSIGNSLTIGAGSKLYSLSHHYRDVENKENLSQYLFGSMVPDSKQYLVESAVVVGNEAAVGLNCILLPGAVIPPETWIGVGMIIGSEKLESNAVYKVKQEWTYKTKGPGGA
jgi:acetyltransferase-like isoleucine patch superfamily enzyme